VGPHARTTTRPSTSTTSCGPTCPQGSHDLTVHADSPAVIKSSLPAERPRRHAPGTSARAWWSHARQAVRACMPALCSRCPARMPSALVDLRDPSSPSGPNETALISGRKAVSDGVRRLFIRRELGKRRKAGDIFEPELLEKRSSSAIQDRIALVLSRLSLGRDPSRPKGVTPPEFTPPTALTPPRVTGWWYARPRAPPARLDRRRVSHDKRSLR
jgi:hypothetical protein